MMDSTGVRRSDFPAGSFRAAYSFGVQKVPVYLCVLTHTRASLTAVRGLRGLGVKGLRYQKSIRDAAHLTDALNQGGLSRLVVIWV